MTVDELLKLVERGARERLDLLAAAERPCLLTLKVYKREGKPPEVKLGVEAL